VESCKILLEKWGFIENNKITQKGILATEVHEGNSLLMATAFYDNIWHSSDANEIVVSLSGFLEYQRNDDDLPLLNTNIARAETIAKTMWDDENTQKHYSDWNITHQHSRWVKMWMEGVSSKEICAEGGMDEGTFVRNVLKLSNLVDEWRNLATIMQDTEMIEKMKDINIVREVVIPDSLYLRI
jgi:superfamily II RNA helicase